MPGWFHNKCKNRVIFSVHLMTWHVWCVSASLMANHQRVRGRLEASCSTWPHFETLDATSSYSQKIDSREGVLKQDQPCQVFSVNVCYLFSKTYFEMASSFGFHRTYHFRFCLWTFGAFSRPSTSPSLTPFVFEDSFLSHSMKHSSIGATASLATFSSV